MSSNAQEVLARSIQVAHELDAPRRERPNFSNQLNETQQMHIDWIVENYSGKAASVETPSKWKNNYSLAIQAAGALAECMPHLMSDREKTDQPSHVNTQEKDICRDQKMFTDVASIISHTQDRENSYSPRQDISFRVQDLGLFKPDSSSETLISYNKEQSAYQNVFSFTARIRAKTADISSGVWTPENVAKNLDNCLRGKAETWYTNELSATTRAGLKTNLDYWCTELEHRFKESPIVALRKLENLRYSIRDVRAKKDLEDYVQKIMVLGKQAGTALSEYAQLMTAYHHFDAELRRDLTIPTENTTVTQFIHGITDAKENWFDLFCSPPQSQHENSNRRFQNNHQSATYRRFFPFESRTSFHNNQQNPQFEKSVRLDGNTKDPTHTRDDGRLNWKNRVTGSSFNRLDLGKKASRRIRAYTAKTSSDSDDQEPVENSGEVYDRSYFQGIIGSDSESYEDSDIKTDKTPLNNFVYHRLLGEGKSCTPKNQAKYMPRPKVCLICCKKMTSGNMLHKHLRATHLVKEKSMKVFSSSETSTVDVKLAEPELLTYVETEIIENPQIVSSNANKSDTMPGYVPRQEIRNYSADFKKSSKSSSLGISRYWMHNVAY
ncbi:hypothetical protein K3495_g8113 [Podosphaera aphanis]|nr:hypothetical protein K3495_g8113 [Podosphaera aphanis]